MRQIGPTALIWKIYLEKWHSLFMNKKVNILKPEKYPDFIQDFLVTIGKTYIAPA